MNIIEIILNDITLRIITKQSLDFKGKILWKYTME